MRFKLCMYNKNEVNILLAIVFNSYSCSSLKFLHTSLSITILNSNKMVFQLCSNQLSHFVRIVSNVLRCVWKSLPTIVVRNELSVMCSSVILLFHTNWLLIESSVVFFGQSSSNSFRCNRRSSSKNSSKNEKKKLINSKVKN